MNVLTHSLTDLLWIAHDQSHIIRTCTQVTWLYYILTIWCVLLIAPLWPYCQVRLDAFQISYRNKVWGLELKCKWLLNTVLFMSQDDEEWRLKINIPSISDSPTGNYSNYWHFQRDLCPLVWFNWVNQFAKLNCFWMISNLWTHKSSLLKQKWLL